MKPNRACLLSVAFAFFAPFLQQAFGATLINFDGINGTNFGLIPSSYQPLAAQGVTITYNNVGLYDQGPDHTTGISGGTHWSVFEQLGESTVLSMSFSQPITIPSMWLTTYHGGASGDSVVVTIKAYSDPAGQHQVFTDSFTTPTHGEGAGNYVWSQYTGLASAPSFERIDVSTLSPGGTAQIDDMTVNVPEPTTWALFALGTFGAVLRRSRKRS